MESCGYLCLRYLLQCSGKEERMLTDKIQQYRTLETLSFADLHDILAILTMQGMAYVLESKDCFEMPCIAHLSIGRFEHFVVLLRYHWIVTYMEPGKGVRRMPRCLFNLAFRGKIFLVDCF